MNIQHLQYFKKIVETGQITEAAKKLYVTQPALTNAIKSLEKEIGLELFSRNGHRLEPTDGGRIFYRYVSRALDNIEEGASLAKQVPHALQPVIRIGREHQVRAEYFNILIDISRRKSKPDLEVETTVAARQELVGMLERSEIDAIVTLAEMDEENVRCVNMGYYDLVAVVNRNNPLARRDSADAALLSRYKLVSYHPSAPLAGKTPLLLKERGLSAEQDYDEDNMLYLAASGDENVIALVRYTSDIKLYPQVKALAIEGMERGTFGTYLSAKWGPYRTEEVDGFLQVAFTLAMPDTESFQKQMEMAKANEISG
ncbi:LysR family transcriptional regulator [Arabiibacter massiliensis]|uniref:LysR family transcriptional regulator n=1 Tax=Arabiibacter massiliensis TaxID=1870985 RepID=UPI0009BA5E1A|nr:LysR family transcriptional regulator [Arabiibacter massiliensis]